jgi:hypothetical protein
MSSATPSPIQITQHFAPPAPVCGSAANRRRELNNDGDYFHGHLPLFRPHGIALAGEARAVRRSGPDTGQRRASGVKLHGRKQAAFFGPRGRLDRPAQLPIPSQTQGDNDQIIWLTKS